ENVLEAVPDITRVAERAQLEPAHPRQPQEVRVDVLEEAPAILGLHDEDRAVEDVALGHAADAALAAGVEEPLRRRVGAAQDAAARLERERVRPDRREELPHRYAEVVEAEARSEELVRRLERRADREAGRRVARVVARAEPPARDRRDEVALRLREDDARL